MKETKVSILRKLFLSTLYISAFTFGGGFVIITFMKRKLNKLYSKRDMDSLYLLFNLSAITKPSLS